MDRRWKIPALLILLSGIAATGQGSALPPQVKWIASEAQFEELSSEPTTCERPVKDSDLLSYTIGSVAFRTPLLLGGQAARAGLSCASCHANGRSTKAFHFPGLSGAPGTADVTSSIMSKMRGDRVFNPKPIPDLAVDRSQVASDPNVAALDQFIRGQIVEEFDGPDPAPAILSGLASYVRTQGGKGCVKTARQPITLDSHFATLRLAVGTGEVLANQGDTKSAWLMIAGARAQLGEIHSRYTGAALAEHRMAILDADKKLQVIQTELGQGQAPDFESVSLALEEIGAGLKKDVERSLYNPKRLASALNR